MSESHYFDKPKNYKKRFLQTSAFFLMSLGFLLMLFIFFPLISWQIFLSQKLPIDNSSKIYASGKIDETSLINLFRDFKALAMGEDFKNINTWFSNFEIKPSLNTSNFFISIEKLKIVNATISSSDTNLTKHLVNVTSRSIPSGNDNVIIFGLSKLPSQFKTNDYETIFSNLYTLSSGDEIKININNKIFTYKVVAVNMINPQDSEFLNFNNSTGYLMLVTNTPPGTVWKRLIITARIE